MFTDLYGRLCEGNATSVESLTSMRLRAAKTCVMSSYNQATVHMDIHQKLAPGTGKHETTRPRGHRFQYCRDPMHQWDHVYERHFF